MYFSPGSGETGSRQRENGYRNHREAGIVVMLFFLRRAGEKKRKRKSQTKRCRYKQLIVQEYFQKYDSAFLSNCGRGFYVTTPLLLEEIIECIFPQGVERRVRNREKMDIGITGKQVLLSCFFSEEPAKNGGRKSHK